MTVWEPLRNSVEAGISRRDAIAVAAGALGMGSLALSGCGSLSPADVKTQTTEATTATLSPQPTTLVTGATADSGLLTTTPYVVPSVTDAETRASNIKQVLVVVDYQVDFVDGALGRIEPAIAIEDALCEVVERYQDRGDIVIYTMDTHPQDTYSQTREGTFNPPHCIPGTEGWEIYGKARNLLTPEKAILVKKGTYGSSSLPGVIQEIKGQGIDIESIELSGVSTSCRVFHNAIILYNFFPEVEMVMDSRTTAAYSDADTEFYLKRLEDWGFCIIW
jgi:nicotinamidase-related amidase